MMIEHQCRASPAQRERGPQEKVGRIAGMHDDELS
jgi:hypothetical protein